jgi:hypothetical protein
VQIFFPTVVVISLLCGCSLLSDDPEPTGCLDGARTELINPLCLVSTDDPEPKCSDTRTLTVYKDGARIDYAFSEGYLQSSHWSEQDYESTREYYQNGQIAREEILRRNTFYGYERETDIVEFGVNGDTTYTYVLRARDGVTDITEKWYIGDSVSILMTEGEAPQQQGYRIVDENTDSTITYLTYYNGTLEERIDVVSSGYLTVTSYRSSAGVLREKTTSFDGPDSSATRHEWFTADTVSGLSQFYSVRRSDTTYYGYSELFEGDFTSWYRVDEYDCIVESKYSGDQPAESFKHLRL